MTCTSATGDTLNGDILMADSFSDKLSDSETKKKTLRSGLFLIIISDLTSKVARHSDKLLRRPNQP